MAWVDNGAGQWVWEGIVTETGLPEQPDYPAPSSGRSARNNVPAASPELDARAKQSFEQNATPEQKAAVAAANSTSQDPRKATQDSWYSGIVQPNVDELNTMQEWLRGTRGTMLAGATAPRRAGLATPDDVANFGLQNTQIEGGGQLDPFREDRAAAQQDMRDLLGRIYGEPSVALMSPEERQQLAAEYEDRAMQQQLSVGRSAAGGLAGVQAGVQAATEQRPVISREAGAQAREESRAINADRMSQFRSELDRATTAAGVTQQIGQAATSAFGQEADIRVQQASLGLGVTQELGKMTGVELELDQRQRENMGRLATDVMKLDLQSMELSMDQQMAFFDQVVRMYGIDQATYAAIRTASIQQQIGPLDVLQMIGSVVGAGATIGAAAAGKK